MPMVYIWTHEGKSEETLKGISDGIAAAMQSVLKVPPDTFDHFINEMPKGRMIYDRNYFGVPRSEAMTFIHFFFNTRPRELKAAFFEAVADEVTRRAGLDRADLLMSITEVSAENWWAFGRSINPDTGYDTRMQVDQEGNATQQGA